MGNRSQTLGFNPAQAARIPAFPYSVVPPFSFPFHSVGDFISAWPDSKIPTASKIPIRNRLHDPLMPGTQTSRSGQLAADGLSFGAHVKQTQFAALVGGRVGSVTERNHSAAAACRKALYAKATRHDSRFTMSTLARSGRSLQRKKSHPNLGIL